MADFPEATFLRRLDSLALSQYRVVADYYRFEPRARQMLRQLAERIGADLSRKPSSRTNYLMWSEPGSGKTALFKNIKEEYSVHFVEANVGKIGEKQFAALLALACKSTTATLCLVDEIDSRPGEDWVFNRCFAALEESLTRKTPLVFALVGSAKGGIDEMMRAILPRSKEANSVSKGSDLMSRVFKKDAKYVLPAIVPEDRILIFLGRLLKERPSVRSVDKAALFHLLRDPSYADPREVDELARRTAALRVRSGGQTLAYSQLFDMNDLSEYRFWNAHAGVMEELATTGVAVSS